MFTEKDEVDALFARLGKVEENNEALRKSSEEIIEQCDDLIHRQILLNRPMSRTIIALTFAAKMEIYSRLGRQDEIRKNYADFVRTDDAADKSLATPNLFELKKNLTSQLSSVLPLKEGVVLTELSVPDALASASFCCEDDINKNYLRKIFHELWQVEALKPLMENVAYAACGHYCGDKIKDREKLKLIFSNKLLSGYFDSGHGSGLSQGDTVWISLAGNNEHGLNQPRSDATIKNTIIHELHHFWEKFSHDSYSALPYEATPPPPKKRGLKLGRVVPVSDPNEAIKKTLGEMCEEAKKVGTENSVKIKSRFNRLGTATVLEPYNTFIALDGYPKDDYTRHAEIVVRVPAALAGMVGNGCDEARAFELMHLSGLTKCVDFFGAERARMREISEGMAKKFGAFVAARPITEIPDYAKDSSSTRLHDTVRERTSIKELVEIIETNENPMAKDGLGQTALELAMLCDDPKFVFAFSKSSKVLAELGKNLTLLRRLVFYLVTVGMNDDDPESAQTACDLFRAARSKIPAKTPAWNIFYEAKISAINPALVEKLKTKTSEELVAEIERGEFDAEDRFGNHLGYYCFKAGRKDLEELVEKNYFTNVTTKKLTRLTPLHRAAKENNPENFLAALDEIVKSGGVIPERLNMFEATDSLLKHTSCGIVSKRSNEAVRSGWLAVAKKLIVEFGVDATAIVGEDKKSFAEFLAKSAPEMMKKLMEDLPTEFSEKIQKFLDEKKALETTPKTVVESPHTAETKRTEEETKTI